MTANPFLPAIIAEPDDDLIRLQYADWLEDAGPHGAPPELRSPERAEFIRVGCELARYDAKTFADCPACETQDFEVVPPYRHAKDCPRSPYHPLRRREAELLFEHGPRWEYPVIRLFRDGVGHTWGRGFICSLSLSWADFSRHADAILTACPIRHAKDGLVSLTTWPDVVHHSGDSVPMDAGGTKVELAGRWPGVPFELPAEDIDRELMTEDARRAINRMAQRIHEQTADQR